jgi:hypothetical protein
MATYVYCPRRSGGALELVKALGASRLRHFDGLNFWDKRKKFTVKEGDSIVCWGASCPELEGVKVLNALAEPMSKTEELSKLTLAGIRCPKVYVDSSCKGNPSFLGRSQYHIGGNDLLTPPSHPDFYVVKEKFVKEYRVHSFNGKSIRSGTKILREGFKLVGENEWEPNKNLAHPWIRSFDAGWRIDYTGFRSTENMRRIAHKAVKTLGLVFGAVDIAELQDGNLVVLEVNRSPGIEGGTINAYVKAINKWIEGTNDAGTDGSPSSED